MTAPTQKQLEENRRVRVPSMTPLEDVKRADRIVELIAAFDADARSNDRQETRKKLVTVLANVLPSDFLVLLARSLEQLRGLANMPSPMARAFRANDEAIAAMRGESLPYDDEEQQY